MLPRGKDATASEVGMPKNGKRHWCADRRVLAFYQLVQDEHQVDVFSA